MGCKVVFRNNIAKRIE